MIDRLSDPIVELRSALGWFALVWIYFLPAMIAWSRGTRDWATIFWFNLLAGWTVFGWATALLLVLLTEDCDE